MSPAPVLISTSEQSQTDPSDLTNTPKNIEHIVDHDNSDAHPSRNSRIQATIEAPSTNNHDGIIQNHPRFRPAPALSSSRYNRQMLIPAVSLSGQQKINAAKILIVGLGGLGSPAALYLAAAGIGILGLLDDDLVETSNLHRQIVHREDSVEKGMSKVASATRQCKEINSGIMYIGYERKMAVTCREDGEELMRIVSDYDIVLDCTDNPATRYLISDLCVLLGKTLVSGAAQRLEGQVVVLNFPHMDGSSRGPCYRCVFPVPPSPDMVKGCSEIGILGPVVGTIGTLMATEALRFVVKNEEIRKPTMLLYNAWADDPKMTFRTIKLSGPRPKCSVCGEKKTVTKETILEGDIDYIRFCGTSNEVKILDDQERLSAIEFLQQTDAIVVDTREIQEVEMGSKIANSINVPFSSILRQKELNSTLQGLLAREDLQKVLFICQRGNDSQIAAKKMIEAQAANPERPRIFIGDVKGGFAAVERVIEADLRP